MQRSMFLVILGFGFALSVLVYWNSRISLGSELAMYRSESADATTRTVNRVKLTFDDIYRAMRTVARLPGVRSIDWDVSKPMYRNGTGLDGNTRLTVQEIYNALVSDVAVSELYIVPIDLDPDGTDPQHVAPREPFTTFDKFIVGLAGAKATPFADVEDAEEIEEIEIFEYRLMRTQLDWMLAHCPTEQGIVGLDYPALGGPPVVTCDNSRFNPDVADDADRTGLVLSVPIFDGEGVLRGCVSGVILNHALSDLLQTGNEAIFNASHQYIVPPHTSGQWETSQEAGVGLAADDQLLYSEARPIPTADRGGTWMLWVGHPEEMFWSRSGVRATLQSRTLGFAAVFILTVGALVGAIFIRKGHLRLAEVNSGLEEIVVHRTATMAEARDDAVKALERERITATELSHQKRAIDEHTIVSATDIKGNIIYANDRFCKISGYAREELIGQNHRILKSDEHSATFYRDMWKTLAQGRIWRGEVKNRAKDGSFYWVEATLFPFKDDAGRITQYVAIRTDITEHKEHEGQLREHNETMREAWDREKAATSELEETMKQLKTTMAQLAKTAATDKLTGLPNRAVFLDRLGQMMKQSLRESSRFAVLFFDFDRFKVVNDSLGHDVGDALLCDIAEIFHRELRESDTVARFGGDEFVVLLGNLSSWEDAEMKAEKLLHAFAAPHHLDDHLIVSTASIGLVTNKRAYERPTDMIRDADAAMYQAKDNGKAQVVVFDGKMHEKALDRLTLEADLRLALSEKQLRLVYQPIVDLQSGDVTGFEALIRWDHPERGVVSPVDFIPIAEDTGLIIEIGKWVLNTAAAQIADWNRRFGSNRALAMNVNVSKRQLLDPSFMEDALECQRTYNLHSKELKLEVTESTIADDRSDVVPLLHKLRDQGFPIAMDDFGTGMSSLSTLHEFPVDVLKIDKAFIRVLDRDRSLLAVVSSITTLADNLGIKTVAEGVETADIVGALQSIDCTWGQGFYFARPLSVEDAEQYIIGQRASAKAA